MLIAFYLRFYVNFITTQISQHQVVILNFHRISPQYYKEVTNRMMQANPNHFVCFYVFFTTVQIFLTNTFESFSSELEIRFCRYATSETKDMISVSGKKENKNASKCNSKLWKFGHTTYSF